MGESSWDPSSLKLKSRKRRWVKITKETLGRRMPVLESTCNLIGFFYIISEQLREI